MLNTLNKQARLVLTGIALTAILVLSAQWAKKTQWAAINASPPKKQMGNRKGAVTLIEYSDFQCPSCKTAQPHVKELVKNYPNDILLIFKHFPLENHHIYARAAAEASECAGDQQKFWEFHDLLFERQEKWSALKDAENVRQVFIGYAQELGLKSKEFQECLNKPSTKAAINADIAEGDARQVDSTPTFFLNSYRLVGGGQVYREGARLVEMEIRNAKGKRARTAN